MREIGFTSKVFSPRFDRRPAFGRRAAGRRDRPRDLQQGRPDRDRRTDDRALADRDRKGLSLRAHGARRRPLDPVHRPQHSSRLRHRRAFRRARSRPGRAGGDQGGDRLGREADRLHGAYRASRRASPPSIRARRGGSGLDDRLARPPSAPARVAHPPTARSAASSRPIARRSARSPSSS